MQLAAAAGWLACVGLGGGLAGCGNGLRPVVATIGVVGPAGQPQKYAVAISTPTPPAAPCPAAGQPTSNGLLTMVDFSGDTVLVTAPLGLNPYYLYLNSVGTLAYTLNCDKTVNTIPLTTTLIASQILESTLPPGTSPVSVLATQSAEYITDQGGTANPGVGVNAIDQLFSSPPALKQTIPIAGGFTPVYVVGQTAAARIYALDQATNGTAGQAVAIETSGNTISATLPVGRGPVYGVMTADSRRVFVLNQTDGTVSVINSQTDMLDTPVNTIPVGCTPAGGATTCPNARPVWADLAPGLNELVVANEGTGTTPGSVSLINIPLCSTTALPTNPNCDATNPIDASTFGQTVATVPVGINPIMVTVLADSTRAYVANAGTGKYLCSGTTTAGTGNITGFSISNNVVTFTAANSFQAGMNFAVTGLSAGSYLNGQTLTVLPTGLSSTQFEAAFASSNVAFTPDSGTAANEACTVSVVSLLSDTVTATIGINGHPVYIASTDSTPAGKVYVVCKDSQVMTVIKTDTDSFYLTIPLQGYGVSVRTSEP